MKRFASRAFALAAVGFAGIITPAWGQPTVNFDVDGDGRSDVLVSTLTDPAGAAPGHVSIISGLSGQELRVLVGRSASEQFGVGAAVIGDVTGDGVRDVAVAAPGADWESTAPGRVDVFDAVTGDLLYELRGANYLALGWRMAPTRDWNADGVRDIAVWSLVLWSGTLVDGWSLFSGADGTFLGWGLMPERWWERIVDWPPAGVSKPRPRADVDANGRVTFSDLGTLQSVLHTPIEPGDAGDVALDGVLNELDLVEVVLRIGTEEPAWLDRVASAMASQSSTGSLLGHLTAGVPPWSSSGAFGTKKTPHGQMHMDGGVTPGGVLEDDEFEPCGLVVMLEHPDRVTLDQEFEVVPYGSVYLTNDLIDLFGGWGALGLPAGALDSWSLLPDVGVRVRSGFTPGEIAVRAGAGLTGGAMDCPIGGWAVVPVSACPVIALEHAPVYGLGPGQAIVASVAPAGGTLTWEVLAGQDVIAWDPDQAGATFAFEGVGIGPVIVRASYTHPLSQGCVEHAIAAFEVIPGPGDCNGDGISDLCEYQYLGSVNCSVAPVDLPDTDGDGLNDLEECTLGTDPNYFDSDYDGLPDGTEVGVGSNPLTPDGDGDLDGDGLTNFEEHVYGTDPTKADTDGDGVNDATEVGQGSNPNDASDGGVAPSPEELVEVEFVVGDDSGSHSERWQLVVGDIRVTAPGYGELTPPTRFKFRRGRTYEMRMVHLGSKQSPPDMDGEARATIVDDPSGSAFIYDPQSLLRYYDDACNDNGCNPFEGKVAYLCTPFVDLDIDSDNANGLESSQAEEDREEAAGDPGKILLVNDDDDDGDGLPDYADGFGLITGDSALDELYRTTAAEKFVPMSLVVSENIDFEATTVTFAYDASDPAAVEVGSDPYMPSLPPGTLRIWTRDGWEERDPRSVADGGHFVPTGIAVPASELPRTLYVEAVAVPEDVAEIVVSLGSVGGVSNPCQDGVAAATDRVRISPVRFGMRRVHADGTTSPLDTIPVSTAGPVFSGVQVSVANLRLSADSKRILGDIHISGSLRDALSDLVPGEDGEIREIHVFLNSLEEPVAILPTQVVKSYQEDASSALAPWPFAATFSTVIESGEMGGGEDGFVLQPGVNAVTLVAMNSGGYTGTAVAVVDVVVTPPDPVVTVVEIGFPEGHPQYAPDGPLDLTISVDDQVVDEVRLYRDASYQGSGIRYGTTWIGGIATGDGGPGPVLVHHLDFYPVPEDLTAAIIKLDPDIYDHLHHGTFIVRVAEGADPTGQIMMEGHEARLFEDQDDLSGASLGAGDPLGIEASGPGQLFVIAFGVEAPSEAVNLLESLGLAGLQHSALDASWHQESRVVLFGGRFIAGAGPGTSFDADVYLTDLPRMGDKAFFDGLLHGYADTISARVHAIGDAAELLGAAAETLFEYAKRYNSFAITLRIRDGETIVLADDQRRLRAAWAGAQQAADIMRLLGEGGVDFFTAVMTGDVAELYALSNDYAWVLEIGAELFAAVKAEIAGLEDLDDYEQGRIVGRVTSEVTVELLTLLWTGGTAQAAKAATVAQVLQKLRAVRYMDRLVNVIDFAVEKYNEIGRLIRLGFCFTAGTPVWTIAGPVPIEQIRPGDLVLARCEQTGAQGYRPVVETVVTRPESICTLTFRAAGGQVGNITGTPEHPFWSMSAGRFVPMGELVVGDALALADGSVAVVEGLVMGPVSNDVVTYNFEVDGWHTYFVADAGVWVHNRGGRTCSRLASIYQRLRDRGEEPWPAFRSLLARTEHAAGRRLDSHLILASEICMRDAYELATRDGVDLSKVPTVTEMYEALGFSRREFLAHDGAVGVRFWSNGRARSGGFDVHHTAAQAQIKVLFKQQSIAFDRELLDSMPGILLNRPTDHVAFGRHLNYQMRLVSDPTDALLVARAMERAYSSWDPERGPLVWQCVRRWMIDQGLDLGGDE